MPATLFSTTFANGGRTTRFGEFTLVFLHGCAFATSSLEFAQMQSWARGRVSTGNAVRDRTMFTDRFDTLLARVGSGLATRGNRQALSRLVKAMTANAMLMEEWNVPRNLDESMEMPRKVAGVPVKKP